MSHRRKTTAACKEALDANKKSFVGLEPAYSFLLEHSSQISRTLEALTPVTTRQHFETTNIRVCIFGCGDVEIALHLLTCLKTRHIVEVTLIDTHEEWLAGLESAIREKTDAKIATHETIFAAKPLFDLIIAHHTMYYVPDLSRTIELIRRLLSATGLFIATLASPSNKLKQCAAELFGLKGENLPYWQEPDLEAALAGCGFAWKASSIYSAITCADTAASRTALINFLVGTLETPSREALDLFAPFQDAVQLHIPMVDSLMLCQRQNLS